MANSESQMANHILKNYYYFYLTKGKEGLPEPVLRAGQRRFHLKNGAL